MESTHYQRTKRRYIFLSGDANGKIFYTLKKLQIRNQTFFSPSVLFAGINIRSKFTTDLKIIKEIHLVKKYLFLLVILTSGFTLNHLYTEKVKSLLTQMKLSEKDAGMNIFSNLSNPSFYIPGASGLKGIVKGERPSMVLAAADYIKQQTKTEDFIKRYNEYREMKKPDAPKKPETVAEMKEKYRNSMKEGIVNMEQLIKQMPDQKAAFQETINTYNEQLKEIDNPDNPMFSASMEKMIMDGYNQQVEIYNQKMAEWEAEYPVNNPNGMIKTWLNSFLEKSGSIDFNAETKEVNGNRVFVNQNYERKDHLWKLCFRAGKETVETARTLAQKWLAEL
jgi:hypothetical protein